MLKAIRRIMTIPRRRRGATAVEFALVAPIFIVIVVAVMEISRAIRLKRLLQFACEETTRYAIAYTAREGSTPSASILRNYAFTKVQNVAPSDISASTFTASIDTSSSPNTATVSANYTFNLMIPIDLVVSGSSLSTFTLQSKSYVPLPSTS